MNYLDSLKEKATDAGNILCMGLDPILEKIPLKGSDEEVITNFYSEILDNIVNESVKIPSVKPNIAFFEQYGFPGLRALKKIIKKYKRENIDIILDAKRGDVEKSSAAYAKSVFKPQVNQLCV